MKYKGKKSATLKLLFGFFREGVMRDIIPRHLNQQRIPFYCFNLLYEMVQGGWSKSDSGDVEDYLSQISKGQCLLRSRAPIAFPYHFFNMAPGSHVLRFVIGYSFSDCRVLFFTRPSLGLVFFLILPVLGKQVIRDCLSCNAVPIADDFEGP